MKLRIIYEDDTVRTIGQSVFDEMFHIGKRHNPSILERYIQSANSGVSLDADVGGGSLRGISTSEVFIEDDMDYARRYAQYVREYEAQRRSTLNEELSTGIIIRNRLF